MTDSLLERLDGPDYLTETTPDPDAIDRLETIDSHTAQRLVKLVQGDWPGILSIEDFLAPLAAADGDIVLRMLHAPGNDWVWWRGNNTYGRVSALAHRHNHKITGRRKANVNHLEEYFSDGQNVVPVHVKNAPDSIWDCIKNDRPYNDTPRP